jgi:type IV pilus assembly protein PilM
VIALPGASSVGLDIGTSAVRAARVVTARGRSSLIGFGQVALPHGAVVEGEVRDAGAISEAIAQLWRRARMRPRSAVIGVANQRVVVRTVGLGYMEEQEFRASLRFLAPDHIPMPVDAAELDFRLLEEYTSESGEPMMRVLLVAAATDMIESFVEVVSAARVRPVGVDLAPFAAARAVSAVARGELGTAAAEAVVDVGASVTNIVVHHGGQPRFVRILMLGGDDPTSRLADQLALSFEEAEAVKLDLGRGVGSGEAHDVLRESVATIVEEIRGSLDYYASSDMGGPLSAVLLTGGGSLTAGLISQLEQSLRVQVSRAAPLADVDVSRSGLTPDQVAQIEPVAATAIGLATGVATR